MLCSMYNAPKHRIGDSNMTEYELGQQYDEMLNDVYGLSKIGGYEYDTAQALREVDPIAYRVGMADYADSLMTDDDTLIIEGYSS